MLRHAKVLYIGRGNKADIEGFTQAVEAPRIVIKQTEPVKRLPDIEPTQYITLPTDQPGVVRVIRAPTQ